MDAIELGLMSFDVSPCPVLPCTKAAGRKFM